MIGMFKNSRRNMLGASLCVLLMFGCTCTSTKGHSEDFIELLQSIVADSTQPSRRRRLPALSSDPLEQAGTPGELTLNFKDEWTHKIWRKSVPHFKKFEHILDSHRPDNKNCVRCCAGLAPKKKSCCKCGKNGIATGISKFYQCSRSDCADNKNPCKTCKKLGKADDTIEVAGKYFSKELRTESKGVDYVIKHTSSKPYKRVDEGSPGRTAAVIIGAGYHILNAFRTETDGDFGEAKKYPKKERHKMEGDAPCGVVVAKGEIKTDVTIQEMINSINEAACVYIKEGEFDVRYGKNTRRFKLQKRRVINWLNTFTKFPERTQITSVREAISYRTKQVVKPSWVPGIINELNKKGREVQFVIDFGSGKVALTDKNGCQDKTLAEDYYNKETGYGEWTIADYIEKLKRFMKEKKLNLTNVVARFTGRHRDSSRRSRKKNKTQAFIAALAVVGIQAEILSAKDEAKYGTESGLQLAAPYFKNVYNFLVVELGRGSHQFGRYRQVLRPAEN